MKKFLVIGILLFIISGCQSNGQDKASITVAAAASLSDAMKELNTLYENQHPNSEVTLNLASSGVLANQIKQGAPIDVYLSASEDHFKEVEDKELIDARLHTKLLSNKLVLITGKSSPIKSWEDLLSVDRDRVAVGTPETVPAGAYAKEALQSLQMWDKLEDKLIFAKDVRQVLTYVETGNADAGIVYDTDFRTSNDVNLVDEAPQGTYTPIIYPAGVIRGAHEEAKSYFTFLQSEEAMTIFKKYGFQKEVSTDG